MTNLPLSFRQAANSNQVEQLRGILSQDKSVIDSQGAKSGMTALHRATDMCRMAALRFLLSNGVNLSIEDKNKETPLALAERLAKKDNKYVKVVDLFNTVLHCKKAMQLAKKCLPDDLSKDPEGKIHDKTLETFENEKPHHHHDFLAVNRRVKSCVTNLQKRDQEQSRPEVEGKFAYFHCGFLSSFALLKAIDENKLTVGYCGAISAAMKGYFLTHPTKFPFRFEELTIHGIKKQEGAHRALVINRKEDSLDNIPDTWGEEAIYCTSFKNGDFYFIKYRPDNSILNSLPLYSVNFFEGKISNPDKISNPSLRKLIKEICDSHKSHLDTLLTKLTTRHEKK